MVRQRREGTSCRAVAALLILVVVLTLVAAGQGGAHPARARDRRLRQPFRLHPHPLQRQRTGARARFLAAAGGSTIIRPPTGTSPPSSTTSRTARPDGRSNILDLDDPRFRNPIIYMPEPGYWIKNEEEAANLRAYLLKGGFISSTTSRAKGT